MNDELRELIFHLEKRHSETCDQDCGTKLFTALTDKDKQIQELQSFVSKQQATCGSVGSYNYQVTGTYESIDELNRKLDDQYKQIQELKLENEGLNKSIDMFLKFLDEREAKIKSLKIEAEFWKEKYQFFYCNKVSANSLLDAQQKTHLRMAELEAELKKKLQEKIK